MSFCQDNAKVPTTIYYDEDTGEHLWGYDIPMDVEPISWFKLLLADPETLPSDFRKSQQLRRAKELVRDSGKTPVQVVADYLHLLWDHAISEMRRDRGDPAVDGSPFQVWLTVPAIWDQKAKDRMIEAAKLAGITARRPAGQTELCLVAEPEAAALAVLNDFKGRPDVKVSCTICLQFVKN
jgi:molecular chaperone DnaK (HSP70)